MQLLIDAGNTRIKWAVPVADTALGGQVPVWLHSGSVSHAELANLDHVWRAMPITRVLISNVAGAAIRAKLSAILQDVQPAADVRWFASQERVAGIHNTYRNPAQLGCDRLASMVGAHYLFPQQGLVVATCGTATTVDAVTAQGQFEGGMILPGLKLMAESLARNTAQLPQVAESISLAGIFADNTDQAIVSGCISAQVGAIRRAVSMLEEQQKQSVSCVISGGAAPYLLAHLSLPYQHVDNLVLTGLFVVAQSSPD
ncbi:type III pantothenate kinase [Undibacterium sp. CY18W]|uniref:Type III pantothenate kinase n=1 Tax=Undibacterium hunanense TaxID=2762292 RepID=A0ABR6ZX48_9BURK|nr:type III pantothenate kinase [Undibacterium hunanense]MBC3920431.1 type III pantothenate kinase [Undibacterium hunanense]